MSGGEVRRQDAGVGDILAPGGEAVALAPGRIVDERGLLPHRPGVGEDAAESGDQGIDVGELGGEGVVNLREIPFPPLRCRWMARRVLRSRPSPLPHPDHRTGRRGA
jgi:hypothetical protein